MVSKISEGVEISVEAFYQQDYSNPLQSEFMFAYRITIENHNSFPVKLHSRHWFIFDSDGSHREVEGEGVGMAWRVRRHFGTSCHLYNVEAVFSGAYLVEPKAFPLSEVMGPLFIGIFHDRRGLIVDEKVATP